jgi:hypothetical protein
MRRKAVAVCLSFVLAVVLVVLGAAQAAHLQRGYSISISMGDNPDTVYHDPFPLWVKAGHAVTALAAMTSLVFFSMLRPVSIVAAWAAFASATAVGIYDIYEYGTIGTPTSGSYYLLVFVIAAVVTFWTRSSQRRT